MTCPKCGAPIAPGLRFCKQCWTALDDGPELRPEATPRPHHGPLFGVGYEDQTVEASGPLHATFVDAATSGVPAPIPRPARAPMQGSASTRAAVSMVFGLLSILFFCGFPFTLPVDLLALGLSFVELRAIARGERPVAGRGMALTGLLASGIVLAVKAFFLLLIIT